MTATLHLGVLILAKWMVEASRAAARAALASARSNLEALTSDRREP